jgi:PaRep2b protein.
VVQDAAVVAALVLYKTLVKNAGVYREWAWWYRWARGLVDRQEFTVAADDIERLRGAHRRLEEVAEEVGKELNSVLALYALHSRELYEKLRPHLEVDVKKAEELAVVSYKRLSDYSDANMGTKAYAALLSIARGGIYGHAATLFMVEGALAEIVLSAPVTAYDKAWEIAKWRGEAVDPSRVGAAGWEDRAASALLRYLLGRAISEDLMFRRVKGGFEVFRTYGGVEARVDVLKIGEVVHSKAGEEELRRFVEEARRETPDLSGIKKIWHVLPWFATDASFFRKWIVAATADTRQAAWYIGLFGEPESIRGRANITEEGRRPNVTMYWRREDLDHIIAEEGKELEPLLRPVSKQGGSREAEGPAVKSWRELVDAIDWSWVLKKVEEMVNELKPWIGPEKMSDAEREGLARRALGELAFLAHFAETRGGMDDGKWREERAKRLAKAVEVLSGGRIAGEYAERLARAIIRYAEGYKKESEGSINRLAGKLASVFKEDMKRVREEVWGVVERVLSGEDPYVYCLTRDCADDKLVRKFAETALELMMLDKALRGEFDRKKALIIFGQMYATAVAGDGTVGPDMVKLTVGGKLGGGAALLRLATLHLLSQLLPKELKFDARIYVGEGRYYHIAVSRENAARFMRLLAVTAPSAGGEYLSEKFNEFVKETQVEVRLDKNSIRLTKSGVVADLTISVAGIAVEYNVNLNERAIQLRFRSTDRSRVELAALLLKQAGVNVEVKKVSDKDEWYVRATTHKLVAGCKELRDALAEFVWEAIARGRVGEKKAERWLEELERGRVLMEGWPEYLVRLSSSGALEVRHETTNPNNIRQRAQRLKEAGLVEGKHFSVKMPEGGEAGYVSILKEGLAHAAWLSVHGSKTRRELAASFVEHILQRAKEEGEDVRKKAEEIVREGKARGSLMLKDFKERVEVGGREYDVKVIDGGAVKEKQNGKTLLRIWFTAEVDGVTREYKITYSRSGADNAAVGYAYASANAPGGREADAERFSALVKALTGEEPGVYRMKDGKIIMKCFRKHLDGFKRYVELADAIEEWLEGTDR